MSPNELAAYVEQQIRRCTQRIQGIGADQYAQQPEQLFETMSLDQLFEYAHEELDDIINYAVMLQIRLSRLQSQLVGEIEVRATGMSPEEEE